MNIGILGGGISGLTLQRFLRHPSEVLEKEPVPGGLCRTFWKDGFGFDVGGHILFSKHQHVTDLVDRLLGDNINHCRRANKILFRGRYVKYPFENDLGALEKQDRYDCLIDYLKNDSPEPANLEEWGYHTFGRSIAEKYFLPYNRKIWKTEPREMRLDWVGRVPKPPLEDVVKSALGIETEGYTHQLHFRYPLHGGFESLVKAMIADVSRVHCNSPVRSIRKNEDGWTVVAGQTTWLFDHLVRRPPHSRGYPLPWPRAGRGLGCGPQPPLQPIRVSLIAVNNESLLDKSAIYIPDSAVAPHRVCFMGFFSPNMVRPGTSRYNPIRVSLIAINNESLMDKSTVYIPDLAVLPHRVCFMGFFSPNMVRPGTSSLVAETTVRHGDPTDRLSDSEFLDRVIGDLDRVGILRERMLLSATPGASSMPIRSMIMPTARTHRSSATTSRRWESTCSAGSRSSITSTPTSAFAGPWCWPRSSTDGMNEGASEKRLLTLLDVGGSSADHSSS